MPSQAEISSELKLMVGAVCTVVFEFFCGHILEIFKIKRQTTDKSVAEIYELLTANKGIIGIWDGFVPWGFLMALCKGASFSYGHQLAYNTLRSVHWIGAFCSLQTLDIIASGFGGFFQGIIMSPLLLLKTRVITHDKFRTLSGGAMATIMASFQIGYEIIRDGGVKALTKGMHIFSFKRFADWITRYLFVEMVISGMQMFLGIDCKQHVFWITFAGLLGGTLSALATSVLDVMTALVQDAAKADEKNVGSWQLFKSMISNGKITKGLYVRILHVALTTVVMKNSVPFACTLVMQWTQSAIKRTSDEL